MTLQPVSLVEFKSLIDIRFNNINEGFNEFESSILEPMDENISILEKQKNFIKFFQKALAYNNNYCYVDFYLKNLNSEEIKNLKDKLDINNTILFKQILGEGPYNTIYFKIEIENILDFITFLNVTELFFCTIYFKEYPITIWGNYNLKFPVFYKCNEVIEIYKKIAYSCNLNL